MNKRLVALVTIMALLIGIASCSKKDDKNSETTLSSETVTESIEPTETSETTEESETTEATDNTEVSESKITIPDFELDGIDVFEVTSSNLNNGVWDDVITNTTEGENLSPELTWEEVDGATSYVIYMVDTTASNWIHLKVKDITVTSLETGSLDKKNYIGPYPPSGTHDYVVYVLALRSAPYQMRGILDSSSADTNILFAPLDLNESGDSGNIIAYGMITGTVTAK